MRCALRTGGAQRVHRRLVRDLKCAIAARKTTRETSRSHGTSFPGHSWPSSACATVCGLVCARASGLSRDGRARAKAREAIDEAPSQDLMKLFRFGETVEPIATERAQRDSCLFAECERRRRRQKDLSAVSG